MVKTEPVPPELFGSVVEVVVGATVVAAFLSKEALDVYESGGSERDAQGAISDFELLEANENAARQLNTPYAQLIGARLIQLMPHYAQKFLEPFKQVVLTGTPLVEDYQVPAGFAAAGWYHQQVVQAIAVRREYIGQDNGTDGALCRDCNGDHRR